MLPEFSREHNKILDEIIKERKSVRSFSSRIPPREAVEEIARAGLLAPYASSAPPDENFRRFAVITGNSPKMALVEQLAMCRAAQCRDQFNQEMAQNPELEKVGLPWIRQYLKDQILFACAKGLLLNAGTQEI